MMTAKRRGFTLIEVLAALAIIVVLTLALIMTVKGQVQQAQHKDVVLMVNTVNAQVEVQATDMSAAELSQLSSLQGLQAEGLISQQQYDALTKAKVSVTQKNGIPQLKVPSK